MELFADAHDYGTRDNAIKALDKALDRLGRSRTSVRWLVAVKEDSRFVPVLSLSNDQHLMQNMLALVNMHVAVIS